MKKSTSLLLLSILLLFFYGACQAIEENLSTEKHNSAFEKINIFSVGLIDYIPNLDEFGFISLSDIYRPENENENENEYEYEYDKVIPNKTVDGYTELKYDLTGQYREKFLTTTAINNNDFVFIYDYTNGKLLTFSVNELEVIAVVNGYSDFKGPFSSYDYQIGFKLDPALLKDFKSAFVYIGKDSPFAEKPLIPLVWHKIDNIDFPITDNEPEFIKSAVLEPQSYMASIDHFTYFVKDYYDPRLDGRPYLRHLIIKVQDSRIINDIIFTESEGSSLTPLNGLNKNFATIQWSGELFKHKPLVVFDFAFYSFDCAPIFFIDGNAGFVNTLCDNRH